MIRPISFLILFKASSLPEMEAEESQDVCHLLQSDDINKPCNQSESSVDHNNASSTDVSIIQTSQLENVKRVRKGWRHPTNLTNANIPFSMPLGFSKGLNLTSRDLNQRMVDRLGKMTASSSSSSSDSSSIQGGSNGSFILKKVISSPSRVNEDGISIRKNADYRSLSIPTRSLSDNRGDARKSENDDRGGEMTSHSKRVPKEGYLHHPDDSSLQSFGHNNSLLTLQSQGMPPTIVPRIPSKISSQVLFSRNPECSSCWTSYHFGSRNNR
jgi:hypothetical protein